MGDKPLSRRQVLGALATTGSAGALVGTGTGALFTDKETFTDNGIRASSSVAGVVDIEVDAAPLEEETGYTYEINLPEDVNNNPAYIWVRTLECPKPAQLAAATTIDVSIKECDSEGALPDEDSALSVFNDLREGALLCKGNDPCLQTDGSRTLEVKVKGVEDGYTGPGGPLEFTLEFYGQQCRYEPDPENPFDDAAVIPDCEEPPKVDGKGISFIAFCAKDADTEPDATVTAVTARNDENEPTRATWETDIPVDYVVVKSGPYYTIYNYSGDGGTTSGTVMTGDDPGANDYGKASSFTCPDNNENGNGNNGNNGNNSDNADGGVASCPCALADEKVGGDNGFDGTSTKLERIEGSNEFQVEES